MIDNLFLSAGAMKAGTTWLYNQLKDHPDIYFTPEKEIHYFANKVGIENQLNRKHRVEKLKNQIDRLKNGNLKFLAEHTEELAWYALYANQGEVTNQWYESLFTFNEQKKYCAVFSNLYCLMDEDGWDNVRKTAKNIKVIYTVRDPFKRLWSHYKFHQKWVGNEDGTLDATFNDFKSLLNQDFFWRNAQYADNYLRLKNNLNEDELLVLYMEDTIKNPVDSLERIQNFLGVEISLPELENLDKKVNATKSFNLPQDWEVLIKDKLKPEIEKMKSIGLWHDSWTDL